MRVQWRWVSVAAVVQWVKDESGIQGRAATVMGQRMQAIDSWLMNFQQFRNLESFGTPFPKNQAMILYSSLWNADNWATRGGLVKIDWTQSPFTASYMNFNPCIWSYGTSSCDSNSNKGAWYWKNLNIADQGWIQWVQKNYMIYNYCTDVNQFPQGFAPECYLTNLP
ncbi:hypothetical protein C1H46_008371 [Malus baccata]|uniref:xyloglucan:xyloglucosyl transferase n=1 Tax=Malus baccata TaxID=106549 RepID=A0A540N4U1_MALBA|nr:hypothetical protein C1H46_008371 [Malus baccata]